MEDEKVLVNLDGTTPEFERVLVKDGEHHGKFKAFQIKEMNKWKSEEKEPKIIASVEVAKGQEIPFFLAPKITKGTSGYNNSKLYDLLEAAGILELVRSSPGEVETTQGLIKFLDEHLLGKAGRFGVETMNKGTEREYSAVRKVYEIIKTTDTKTKAKA